MSMQQAGLAQVKGMMQQNLPASLSVKQPPPAHKHLQYIEVLSIVRSCDVGGFVHHLTSNSKSHPAFKSAPETIPDSKCTK